MADEMVQEEIFSTSPTEPNQVLDAADFAGGFPGGIGVKSFFNAIWNRYSEILFDVQGTAIGQKFSCTVGDGKPDGNLVYRDFYIGAIGSDATLRTPTDGSGLINTAGTEEDKYVIGENNVVVRKQAEDYPLYSNCGQDSSLLLFNLGIEVNLDTLSAADDFVAISMNCTGRYERTDVEIRYVGPGPNLLVAVKQYDTNNVMTQIYSAAPLPIDVVNNQLITLKVFSDIIDSKLTIAVPEADYVEKTTLGMVTGSGTNFHGFTMSPQTFSITDYAIFDGAIFLTIIP